MRTYTGDITTSLSSLSVATPSVCGGEYGEHTGNDFCENRRRTERDTGDQGMVPGVEEINDPKDRETL